MLNSDSERRSVQSGSYRGVDGSFDSTLQGRTHLIVESHLLAHQDPAPRAGSCALFAQQAERGLFGPDSYVQLFTQISPGPLHDDASPQAATTLPSPVMSTPM